MKKKIKAKARKPKVKVIHVPHKKVVKIKGPALVTIQTPMQAYQRRIARSAARIKTAKAEQAKQ